MKKVNIDIVQQNIPQFFYKRFELSLKATGYFIIPIDYGYAYLLRTIRTKWPTNIPGEPVLALSFEAKYIQQHASRELQNRSYRQDLISTPGTAGKTTNGTGAFIQGVFSAPAPAPFDAKGFNINFSANPVKNNVVLDYFYQRREALDLRINFDIMNTRVGQYVDVLLCGYYIPDLTLKEWKK